MPSSTSSSEWTGAAVLGYPMVPDTVAPLPGHPEPSLPTNPDKNDSRGIERPIPSVPWLRTLVTVASSLIVLVLVWELQMRHLGLHAGDLDDGRDAWTVERRKVDSGPTDAVVIIGDSRMLFDTDLATWQALTGRRPIQLALPATNAQAFLHDLAGDEHFAGLLVIGTAELSYFRGGDGGSTDTLNYL